MIDIRTERDALVRRPDPIGPGRRTALTDLTDRWLAELFVAASNDHPDFCLLALGSHGRRELAPGSDVDLLLVHRADPRRAATIAEALWYPIWDSGLPLDHSVRTVAETRRLASTDLKVVMGLMDARVIAGAPDLGEQLVSSVLADWRSMAQRRLPELRAMVDERRARFGDIATLLEPDLKESYGGLREASVLRALTASWVTDTPHDRWPTGVDFLLDVREALHLTTGRRTDILLLQEQSPVAQLLGLKDADALLRRVYDAARSIGYASDTTWYRIGRLSRPAPRLVRRAVQRRGSDRVPLADGVVVQAGEVVLAVETDPRRDPVLILRAAAASAQAGVLMAPHTVARLASESGPIPEPWPRSAREAFISLIGAGEATVATWEALDQAGVISRLIPEWEPVRSAPQRDPMHRFTVDRHLVQTAVEASRLTRRVDRPDLLLMGALLHDIGKARGGRHAEVGAELASTIARRMGFDEDETATIVLLVRWHLLLAETATRRDLDDPATIEDVLDHVHTHADLDLLAALTEADSLATNPTLWNDWRRRLIADLQRRCARALSGDPLPEPPGLSDEQQVLLAANGVWSLLEQGEDDVRITIGAPDQVGLLATVAGVLSMHRLQVRAARVITVGARAVQEWTVRPLFGDPPSVDVLTDDLRRALDGGVDLATRMAARDEAYAATAAKLPGPVVTVRADAARASTILEVRAHDAPGLLYRVAASVAAAGASITGAKVSTLGSEVIDVFFLRDRHGQPLSEAHADAVRAAAQARLDEQVA